MIFYCILPAGCPPHPHAAAEKPGLLPSSHCHQSQDSVMSSLPDTDGSSSGGVTVSFLLISFSFFFFFVFCQLVIADYTFNAFISRCLVQTKVFSSSCIPSNSQRCVWQCPTGRGESGILQQAPSCWTVAAARPFAMISTIISKTRGSWKLVRIDSLFIRKGFCLKDVFLYFVTIWILLRFSNSALLAGQASVRCSPVSRRPG